MTDRTGPPAAPPAGRRHWLRWLLGGAALLAAGGIAARGIVRRQDTLATLKRISADEALQKVTLVLPRRGPPSRTLALPGQMTAWYKAPIFAQVTGYVEMWYKDYGAPVKKGDLLAVIATPDLDQQLQRAQASLLVARTHYALARVTAQRWQRLAGTQAVSQQAVDVNVADAKAAQALVQAAQSDVGAFQAKEAFKRVVAPFDGVVTARDTDIGSFVNAAGGTAQQGRTQALFTVSDVHRIRVFVSVPQDYSGFVRAGIGATMTLPQFPGRTIRAEVATTARAFDSNSRTVLTELIVPNPDGSLFPGAYTDVQFVIPTDPGILIVPEQAILFRAQGLQAALVGPDNKVHLQGIRIGLNLGETVQVTQGLTPSDRLVANPSSGLLEGQAVDVVQAPPQNTDDEQAGKAQPAGR